MAPPGDVYERELKALLAGDSKAIAKMVKTCNALEKANYGTMLQDPFLVIRAAGSLGVDLVALRWDFSFPIEVKSSCDDVLHFSKNQRLTPFDVLPRTALTMFMGHEMPKQIKKSISKKRVSNSSISPPPYMWA